MAILVPTINAVLRNAITSHAEIANFIVSAESQDFLGGAVVYHRIELTKELLSPPLLGWFDVLVLFPGRGIVCVSGQTSTPESEALINRLWQKFPGWFDNAWTIYNQKRDNGFWEQLKQVWNLMPESTVLRESAGKVREFLNDELQISELPPSHPVEQLEWLDRRFVRISKQGRVAAEVSEQIRRWNKVGPLRLRINGTAGSGKTLTALHLYREWARQGRRPLLLCYNHRLGLWLYDQCQSLDGFAGTLFHWARTFLERNGWEVAPNSDHMRVLREALDAGQIKVADEDKFDSLIVDEGQDFQQEWVDTLTAYFLPFHSDVIWFEDSCQTIQPVVGQQSTIRIDNISPTVFIDEGFRTPKRIADYANTTIERVAKALGAQVSIPKVYSNDVSGWPVMVHRYTDDADAARQLAQRIGKLRTEGVDEKNMLVLSCMDDASGMLMSHDQVLGRRQYRFCPGGSAELKLKRYAGYYTGSIKVFHPDDGTYCDSILKVKGLEDYVVLLADVDPPAAASSNQIDAQNYVNRLYSAMTRPTARLEVFVSVQNPLIDFFMD